jgi:hypothetical protein
MSEHQILSHMYSGLCLYKHYVKYMKNFWLNINLFAIIYGYLKTVHKIQQKKCPNPLPKTISL